MYYYIEELLTRLSIGLKIGSEKLELIDELRKEIKKIDEKREDATNALYNVHISIQDVVKEIWGE